MSTVSFTVYGIPIPQGSMKAFTPPGFHRPIVTSDNKKLKPWRNDVACAAVSMMTAQKFTRCGRAVPIAIEVTFFFSRPQSVKKSIEFKTTQPDIDKLLRALLDALTGIIYEDDSQVADVRMRKLFDSPARAEVVVREIETFPLLAGDPPGTRIKPQAIRDEDLPF
jgi:Holliday junction resolvase RusA-like endonuclease